MSRIGKFHIAQSGKDAGKPVSCRARERDCPLRDENGNKIPHFNSEMEAWAHIGKESAKKHGLLAGSKSPSKNKPEILKKLDEGGKFIQDYSNEDLLRIQGELRKFPYEDLDGEYADEYADDLEAYGRAVDEEIRERATNAIGLYIAVKEASLKSMNDYRKDLYNINSKQAGDEAQRRNERILNLMIYEAEKLSKDEMIVSDKELQYMNHSDLNSLKMNCIKTLETIEHHSGTQNLSDTDQKTLSRIYSSSKIQIEKIDNIEQTRKFERSAKEWGDNFKHIETDIIATPDIRGALDSTMGQLSDGIWENSPGMDKIWQNVEPNYKDGKVNILYNNGDYGNLSGPRKLSGFYGKDEKYVKDYIANKVKAVVKQEQKDNNNNPAYNWDRNNEQQLSYMDKEVEKLAYYGNYQASKPLTIREAYRAYDALKGRKKRV